MLVLTFQIGNDRLALDIRRVREVVPRVQLERVAGSPAWLAGLFVYRGRVVPVLDLHRLLNAGECPPHLSSRIILVPLDVGQAFQPDSSHAQQKSQAGKPDLRGEEVLVGLLAAQVADIREVQPGARPMTGFNAPGQPDLGLTLVEEGGILHLLDLDRLLPEPVQRLVKRLPGPP
jgi:chemotaxis-related protein WspB